LDDVQAIRLAKTELREAYRSGSTKRVMALVSDSYCDMSAGQASFYGIEAKEVLRHRLRELFARYRVELAVTIISIQVFGNTAFDWGWHKLTRKPRTRGRTTIDRTRYLEIWQKESDGKWRLAIFLDNRDVSPQMPPPSVLRLLNRQANKK
jgi:ketosteroid isomerase-like protein